MWNTSNRGEACVEPAIKQYLPPCQERCPINEDIQRTNVLISLLPEDPKEAGKGLIQIGDYLFEKNPLFPVCGYVCGICELGCNYQSKGGSIRRRLLKRFVSDFYLNYLDQKKEYDVIKDKGNVAVIGGGPGGLMSAFHLSLKGYRVTIFEATNRLGGALWLIPHYRLPKLILQRVIENILRIAGIEVKFNARVGEENLTLERLKRDGFKAVFISKGTPSPRILTFGRELVENQDLENILYGQTFLYEVSRGILVRDYLSDKRVIVIGGGNVAFDVARTARRLGGNVTLVALEQEDKSSKDGIPADKEEIHGAWEEGVGIVYSRGVSKILGKDGKFAGIESPQCIRVFDDEGRFNPAFDTSDTVTIEGDLLIITVGQGPDREFLQKEGLLDQHGRLAVDLLTLQSTTKDWVFIGGDVRKVGFMVDAMRDGLEAAESIERYLKGVDVRAGRKREFEGFEIPQLSNENYKPEPEVEWIPADKRLHFQLYEKGFTLKEAIGEARRCLCCGPCVSCRACISVGLQDELPTVVVHENLCSGCGICVSACHYGAARLREIEGHLVSATDMFKCKACGMCVSACPAGARELIGSDMERLIAEAYASL
ncbi:MAG: 4Fe-4S dicluster domain-containing protein [Deltaproteobacteria bacterium]|nr:4Fe-4S dicluster domain-containing protein [Deltaproteobacteria bacterium]